MLQSDKFLTGMSYPLGVRVAIENSDVGVIDIRLDFLVRHRRAGGWLFLAKAKGMVPVSFGIFFYGMAVGVLFGTNLPFLFSSLVFTTVSSAWILLYTTPFFHTLGAHFFLKGDRITVAKGVGCLVLHGYRHTPEQTTGPALFYRTDRR